MRLVYFISFIFFSIFSFSQEEKTPCPRNQPVIVYHEKENSIFFFGGFCTKIKKRLNDLWKFDGNKWVSISPNELPTARSGHSMVYDKLNNRLLVFGGKNDKGELMNDLWSWDGESWQKISNEGPKPRQSHKMVYNSNNGEIFLFGGSDTNGKALNDTWVFRNKEWAKLESSKIPPARLQHTMSYDQNRDKIVLFGGFQRSDIGKKIFGDTWEWHPVKGWEQTANNLNLSRDHHAMAYDIDNKKTILFGGYNKGYLGDIWSWDGLEWEKISAEGPSARAGKPGLIFDNVNKVLILFGGWDKSNAPLMDFWQFDYKNKSWKNIN